MKEIRVMVAECDNGWFVEMWGYHPRTLLYHTFVAFEDFYLESDISSIFDI